jgi:hypothetical protein
MIIYDLRQPLVSNTLLRAVIGLAYINANHEDRYKYTQVFDKHIGSSPLVDSSPPCHLGSVRETCSKRVGGISENDPPLDRALKPGDVGSTRSRQHIPMHISFPSHKRLKECGWKQFEALRASQPNILYLNPILLDKFERASCHREKVPLLVIMYCIVCHEFAHLLHYKMYNTIDPYFRQLTEAASGGHIDYGTEVEHCIFGGRMLSTPDLSGLRIERKDGEVFDIDFKYFYGEFVTSSRAKIDFVKLRKVNLVQDSGQSWMGMGEINGTHHI